MKDKLERIKATLQEVQGLLTATAADAAALFVEVDAQTAAVAELDAKADRLNVVNADLSKAVKELQDTQQRRASVEKVIADIKAKL